ncbi:MAG: SRPBCC family protein [Mycobacterium sp.]
MPKPHGMACSRAIPVDPGTAMRRTLVLPLPALFSRRYGPMGPIRAVHEYDSEPWGRPGQVRSIVQAGGTTLREELTQVDDPTMFAYTLTRITGPLAPLVDHIDGQWMFTPVGTGTKVMWFWTVHPRSELAGRLMPVFARIWQGFAGRALEQLSEELLRP